MPDTADRLASDLRMDAVTLHVADLDAISAYYQRALGLVPISDDGGVVVLGRLDRPVLVLRHTPGLPLAGPHEAGLFHTAFLFDERSDLAAVLDSAARTPGSRFVGCADHLVSIAFYFTDPEGNGIELYWDRPRTEWTYRDGRVQMANSYVDPRAFVDEHLTEAASGGLTARPAAIGHVHLQVGDVPTAERFYVETLGFETQATWTGALFVSAGGYHHHLAMNTWNSANAGPRASTLGLGEVAIEVPTVADVGALGERLRHHGVATTDDGRTVTFDDPWRNRIRVHAA